MIILGIGGILGDAASAVLKDGELVAAVEESKLVRRRTPWGGPGGLPEHSIATCLELAGARPEDCLLYTSGLLRQRHDQG